MKDFHKIRWMRQSNIKLSRISAEIQSCHSIITYLTKSKGIFFSRNQYDLQGMI